MFRRVLQQPHFAGLVGSAGLIHWIDATEDSITVAPAPLLLASSLIALLLVAAMPSERLTLHLELDRLRTYLLTVHVPALTAEKRQVPGAGYLARRLAELLGRAVDGHRVYAHEVTPFITDVAELAAYRTAVTGTDRFAEVRASALELLGRWRAELPDSPGPTLKASFGQRLQQVLDGLGWSHERLAKEMGVSRAAVTMWANGTRHPGRAHQQALVRVTGQPRDFWDD
jgi:ribosome-binding protein aMBF1 (putative translation factor)/preprotein translocase subunit Sec61beta